MDATQAGMKPIAFPAMPSASAGAPRQGMRASAPEWMRAFARARAADPAALAPVPDQEAAGAAGAKGASVRERGTASAAASATSARNRVEGIVARLLHANLAAAIVAPGAHLSPRGTGSCAHPTAEPQSPRAWPTASPAVGLGDDAPAGATATPERPEAPASQSWARRCVHVQVEGGAASVWIRDASLSGPAAAAVAAGLCAELAAAGVHLHALTVNGRRVCFEALSCESQSPEPPHSP